MTKTTRSSACLALTLLAQLAQHWDHLGVAASVDVVESCDHARAHVGSRRNAGNSRQDRALRAADAHGAVGRGQALRVWAA